MFDGRDERPRCLYQIDLIDKDLLKARRYTWNAPAKVWQRVVAVAAAAARVPMRSGAATTSSAR